MNNRTAVVVLAVLAGALSRPAEARFGKGSKSTSSSTSESSSEGSGTHEAKAVGTESSSGSSTSRASSGAETRGASRPWRYGFYSGAFVPVYGYGYAGYGYGYAPGYAYQSPPPARVPQEPAADEQDMRVTASFEAQAFTRTASGVSLGVGALFEGARWGFSLYGTNLGVSADDGSGDVDSLQQLNLHVTYALVTGTYGRLRLEAGFDSVFAPSIVVVGPTGAVSGLLWITGPFAVEGSVALTPLPYQQLDYRANLAIGLGAFGLRLGWRLQVLDDRGLVDGVIHRDVFQGPWAGLAIVF